MQLFILDRDPIKAAGFLCDVHLRKMCLETCQILSSCLTLQNLPPVPGMPKPYNINHPVIRALAPGFKLNWCIAHNTALQLEYRKRFGKKHSFFHLTDEYRKLLYSAGDLPEDWSFCRNFKDITISTPDIVEAYREYYCFKKKLLSRWSYTNTTEPEWLKKSSPYREQTT
ncbi:MAG: hypothetical protein IKA87_04895 [Lentisphaeria bacterium]|nr:hypothetical protein [Lentisphaeria bacterium]